MISSAFLCTLDFALIYIHDLKIEFTLISDIYDFNHNFLEKIDNNKVNEKQKEQQNNKIMKLRKKHE